MNDEERLAMFAEAVADFEQQTKDKYPDEPHEVRVILIAADFASEEAMSDTLSLKTLTLHDAFMFEVLADIVRNQIVLMKGQTVIAKAVNKLLEKSDG